MAATEPPPDHRRTTATTHPAPPASPEAPGAPPSGGAPPDPGDASPDPARSGGAPHSGPARPDPPRDRPGRGARPTAQATGTTNRAAHPTAPTAYSTARTPAGTAHTTGLLDALGVAAVVLEEDGRVALWSPQAEDLLGYTADEALGRYADRLLVEEDAAPATAGIFERMMRETGGWAGVLTVRHKDGGTLRVELRGMRLSDTGGRRYALGLAAEESAVRDMETGLALAVRLISQSPIGLAVFGTDLRYVSVNPALERVNGLPEKDHLGRTTAEVLPALDTETITSAMRDVLARGEPLVDQHVLGRTPADPDTDRAWSVSFYRLEDPGGRVLGLATSVVDITERYRSTNEAAAVRARLALVADASQRIGTTLDLERTAHELAALCVSSLADVAAVDVLDSVLHPGRAERPTAAGPRGPAAFRALAVDSAGPTPATQAADPPGQVTDYGPERLITRCATSGTAVMVPHATGPDLRRIARDEHSADLLTAAGVHSYLAVPLIARGEVLGVLDLKRARNPLPFTKDDESLAAELAARAAVCIDNARWYENQRHAALALQRHLLPHQPPDRPGLEIAYRYAPAGGPSRVGGDWFDVIGLTGGRTALVVGDVMGSGINAAATMGQVRTATRTLAHLDLAPEDLLRHLDTITTDLESGIATCVYAVHDPRGPDGPHLRAATAGHLPPVLTRPGRPPRLLDLPTGAPLGVGGVPFEAVDIPLRPGDQLVLYTDGLVEARDQSLDAGLADLLALLDDPARPLQRTCDLLLDTLRQADEPDDVALLISRIGGTAEGTGPGPPPGA